MSEKKKKKRLDDTSGSLAGSVLPSDDEDEEKDAHSVIVTSDNTYCPACKKWFPSSSYSRHSPCFG